MLLAQEIRTGGFEFGSFFETSILVAFLFLALASLIAKALSDLSGRRVEDSAKLTEDYDALVSKYSREKMVRHPNPPASSAGKTEWATIPFVALDARDTGDEPYELIVKDSPGTWYELPSQVASRSEKQMGAHDFSTVYNNTNVRLDDVAFEGKKALLQTSRTTYADSLLTNRAMDYPWEKGRSVRETFEPGPFLRRLPDSRLSNHLGFNGFIELSDGHLVFVVRSRQVSVAKGTLSTSVAASMKAAYCLNDQQELTAQGISDAIRLEIVDELGIELPRGEDLTKTIFAFYREVVEGGKPQLLFYLKLGDLDRKGFELLQRKRTAAEGPVGPADLGFRDRLRRRRNKEWRTAVDGSEFVYLTPQDLVGATLRSHCLTLKDGTRYAMTPTVSGATALLLQYLGLVPRDGADRREERRSGRATCAASVC